MRKDWSSIILLAVIFSLTLQSCVRHKDLVTINGNEVVPKDLRSDHLVYKTQLYKYKPHIIRPFDQLMIKVNAFDGRTEDFLNREFRTENTYSRDIDYNPASLYFNSYTVNDSGYVFLPIIKGVKTEGLTLSVLKLMLDDAYSPYLKFASTTVKLANMRVTVLGEVNKPGQHYLYNEQTTLLDAISIAGDFTEFGNRKKVKLIRQMPNYTSKTVYLDLNKYDFVYTEYYYIEPNDMIYVEPIKVKSFDASSRSVGVVISALSLGALIVNLIFR